MLLLLNKSFTMGPINPQTPGIKILVRIVGNQPTAASVFELAGLPVREPCGLVVLALIARSERSA